MSTTSLASSLALRCSAVLRTAKRLSSTLVLRTLKVFLNSYAHSPSLRSEFASDFVNLKDFLRVHSVTLRSPHRSASFALPLREMLKSIRYAFKDSSSASRPAFPARHRWKEESFCSVETQTAWRDRSIEETLRNNPRILLHERSIFDAAARKLTAWQARNLRFHDPIQGDHVCATCTHMVCTCRTST